MLGISSGMKRSMRLKLKWTEVEIGPPSRSDVRWPRQARPRRYSRVYPGALEPRHVGHHGLADRDELPVPVALVVAVVDLGQPGHALHLHLHRLGHPANPGQATVPQEARGDHPNVDLAVVALLHERQIGSGKEVRG